MRFLTLSIISAACLTACATSPPKAEPIPQPRVSVVVPPQQDLYMMGQGLSDGAVDLYEPGVAAFDMPTTEDLTPAISPIPENPTLYIKDPSVTAYSVDTSQPVIEPLPEFSTTLLEPPPERRYAPDLMPVAPPPPMLPDLQPPSSAQKPLPAPVWAFNQ